MTTPKPDGYCAWHEKEGWLIHAIGKTEYAAFCGLENHLQDKKLDTRVSKMQRFKSRGWTIRPVYLHDKPLVSDELMLMRKHYENQKEEPAGSDSQELKSAQEETRASRKACGSA